jgi:ferric-chelate reductase (NADPH)
VSRMEKLLSDLVLTATTVTEIQELTGRFRLIELESEGLRKGRFRPGDKLQIRVAPWKLRTYTPLHWDYTLGRTQLLAFVHADGPGTTWASSLAVGARVDVLGPRSSLPLSDLGDRATLFGDETSVGVAAVLRASRPGARTVLESSFPAETEDALAGLGVDDAVVIPRATGDAHLVEVRDRLRRAAREPGPPQLVLTGRAQSIQAVRALLDPPSRRSVARTKAYWAVGKAGLD